MLSRLPSAAAEIRAAVVVALLVVAVGSPAGIPTARALGASAEPLAAGVVEEVALINADRVAAGLVPYRPDDRLMAIAAERARTMATTGLFSHAGPDGKTAFDLIAESGMAWYGAGEVIAWNTWPSSDGSANAANDGWMASSVHRELLLATDRNYVGVGVATSATGTTYWSTIVMSGPDRTAPTARARSVALSRDAAGLVARFTWTGADVPLQVLTSGLRDFQLQRRTDGGAWYGVTSSTSLRAWSLRVATGHRYEFRVRARDRAGNFGPWTAPVGVAV